MEFEKKTALIKSIKTIDYLINEIPFMINRGDQLDWSERQKYIYALNVIKSVAVTEFGLTI